MAVELLRPETAVAISDHVVITVCFVCAAVFPEKKKKFKKFPECSQSGAEMCNYVQIVSRQGNAC